MISRSTARNNIATYSSQANADSGQSEEAPFALVIVARCGQIFTEHLDEPANLVVIFRRAEFQNHPAKMGAKEWVWLTTTTEQINYFSISEAANFLFSYVLSQRVFAHDSLNGAYGDSIVRRGTQSNFGGAQKKNRIVAVGMHLRMEERKHHNGDFIEMSFINVTRIEK